jgi:hypothetical protein
MSNLEILAGPEAVPRLRQLIIKLSDYPITQLQIIPKFTNSLIRQITTSLLGPFLYY